MLNITDTSIKHAIIFKLIHSHGKKVVWTFDMVKRYMPLSKNIDRLLIQESSKVKESTLNAIFTKWGGYVLRKTVWQFMLFFVTKSDNG